MRLDVAIRNYRITSDRADDEDEVLTSRADAGSGERDDATSALVVAVVAVIFRGDRVLAMRRAAHKPGGGRWETLSGRVEPDEDPLDAVRREIAEECGVDARVDARPFTAYAARRAEAAMVVIVYVAEWLAGEVARSAEHDDHAWLTPDELAARDGFPKLVDVVRGAARARGQPPTT